MDKYANRRIRLQQLIDSQFAGKKAAFAAAVNRQPDYISRCLTTNAHSKRIGEEFAAHIEGVLGLRAGWLDRATDETSGSISLDVSIREELLLELIRSLTPEQQDVFLAEMRNVREANLVTSRVMGNNLRQTISNARMERTYGLPKSPPGKMETPDDPQHPTSSPES